jgi:hypothetical protein
MTSSQHRATSTHFIEGSAKSDKPAMLEKKRMTSFLLEQEEDPEGTIGFAQYP